MTGPDFEPELREAISRDQLQLYYQPAYSLSDGKIGSVEAFLRWDSPGRGIVVPAEFIPTAEESGLIAELDSWAIEQACRQLALWRNNLAQTELFVAVNISLAQLDNPGLIETIRAAGDQTGAPLSRLAVEVGAADLATAPDHAVRRLGELEALGACLVVDGIEGEAVSSDLLAALPLRALRIAGSVVSGLPDDAQCTELARGVIGLGETAGAETIAQNVESLGQLSALRALGCGSAAGFLFGLPEPADVLADTLRGKVRPAAGPPGFQD